jgi:hypothetical protein
LFDLAQDDRDHSDRDGLGIEKDSHDDDSTARDKVFEEMDDDGAAAAKVDLEAASRRMRGTSNKKMVTTHKPPNEPEPVKRESVPQKAKQPATQPEDDSEPKEEPQSEMESPNSAAPRSGRHSNYQVA